MADVQQDKAKGDKTPDLMVDPELRAYLPEVDKETKSTLEESLKKSGRAIHPIEVWKASGGKRVIVDGHNRYELCKKLGLPFDVMELSFPNKEAVKRHMLEVQLRRRNMTKEQMSRFRASYVKLRQKNGSGSTKAIAEAAEDFKTSTGTVKRDIAIDKGIEALKAVEPDLAKEFEAGKSKINKGTVQKIGTAKDEKAKKSAIETAKKEATREHKKATDKKPEPKQAETKPVPPPLAPAVSRDTEKLVEKVTLFLKAKTFAGRKQMMKDVVSTINELEDTKYELPPEYASDSRDTPKAKAKTGNGKQKSPPVTASQQTGMDD